MCQNRVLKENLNRKVTQSHKPRKWDNGTIGQYYKSQKD